MNWSKIGYGIVSIEPIVLQSAAAWMQDEWRVSKLRPLSSEVLVYLATNTRVLADPASLQAHIEQQVNAK